jgi:hypothetical protein
MGSLLESWDILIVFAVSDTLLSRADLALTKINARHHGPSGTVTLAFWTASSGLEGGRGGIEGMLYIALSLD